MRSAILVAILLFGPAVADGVAPLDAAACEAMKAHHVLNAGAPVGCERLAVVAFHHVDFEGRTREGRVVVLDAVAPSVARVFATLYERRFPIARAEPLEAYDGDDDRSMAANNTSGFNHRAVPDSDRLSLHAYGAAIDLDPMQNPFLMRRGALVAVAPPAGADYLNRRQDRPGKPVRAGMAEAVVDVFAENGFVDWGGDWDTPIDYQHFDIGRAMAEKLAALPHRKAEQAFAAAVAAYRRCIAQYADKMPAERRQICATAVRN